MTIFSFSMTIGLGILCLASLRSSIENRYSWTGLIAVVIFIGLGTGAVKVNVSALLVE